MIDIKDFLKKKKKSSDNMVVNDTQIYQEMKSKTWLSIEKNIIKRVKTLYCGNKQGSLYLRWNEHHLRAYFETLMTLLQA